VIQNWQLPSQMMPIDFGLPRVVRPTFKHLYIRFLKEPMAAYGGKSGDSRNALDAESVALRKG
jgi:hypothetical protein